MRTTLKWARAGMSAMLIFATTPSGYVQAADMQGKPGAPSANGSVLRIPANSAFPLTKRMDLGVGRSIVVEFPVPLKDVLVSDPSLMDAVVQSSDRVFLIAKKAGQTNAFFFDEYGQQVLTLEVAIGADLSSLDQLINRLIPGSNVHSEIAGQAIVLTGSVRTPIDSDRAAQIAAQFAAANAGSIGQVNSGPGSGNSTSTTTNSTTNIGGGGATAAYQNQIQSTVAPSTAPDNPYSSKPIINLLVVEGEEQVMLQRHGGRGAAHDPEAVRHQHRRADQFGQLHHGDPDRQQLSADNGGRSWSAAHGGHRSQRHSAFSTRGPTGAGIGGANAGAFGNSGAATLWNSGNQQIAGALRALERDGLLKTLAEPNLTAVSGEPAKFLAGGEFPVPVVDSLGQVSVQFKEYGIGLVFTPVVMSEGRISLEDRNRGQRAHQPGRGRAQQHSDPGLEEAPGQLDGGAAFGRIAGARGPAFGRHAPEHRRLPRPQGRPDPRHAVPQP